MKRRHLIAILTASVVVLILVFLFSVYEVLNNSKIKESQEKKYVAEEIVKEEEITPEETAETPAIEESDKVVLVEKEVTVKINNIKFSPEKITVSPGTTVVWVNEDKVAHKVVAYDRLFYGPRLNPGDSYSFTFTKEGTHRYFDAVFPKIARGTVIVKEEPLLATGGVIGVDLGKEEANGKFALLVLLFAVMVLGLSHGIYSSYRA